MAEREALTVWEQLAFWLLGLECGILTLEEVEAGLDRRMAEDPDPPLACVDAAWSVTKGWLPLTHTLSEALRNRDWSRERVRQALLARVRAGVRSRRSQDPQAWWEPARRLLSLEEHLGGVVQGTDLRLELDLAQDLAEMGCGDGRELQALVRQALYLPAADRLPPEDPVPRRNGDVLQSRICW